MKFWASCSALALALLVVSSGVALKGCWGGGQSCNESLDCLIFCECPGVGVGVTVGPYPCRMGTCGEQHSEDLDCVRPCRDASPGNVSSDDDDSEGGDDDSSPGDDDSGPGDDDSGASG